MLATLHYRDKAPEKAFAVLERALPFHRKNSLLRNVYAYLLNNQGRVDDAIAQLNQLLAKSPDDPIAKDNLLRLQNRKRMDLRGFGTEWYALGPGASAGEHGSDADGEEGIPATPEAAQVVGLSGSYDRSGRETIHFSWPDWGPRERRRS